MSFNPRPLNLGEILDRTIQLYRRNFATFIGIAIVPTAVYIASTFLFRAGPAAHSKNPFRGLDNLLLFFLQVPIAIAAYAFLRSASYFAASQASHGEVCSVRAAYTYAQRHFRGHFWLLFRAILNAACLPLAAFVLAAGMLAVIGSNGTSGFTGILIGLSAIATICLSSFFWLRYSLSFPIAVAESRSASQSLRRSIALTRGARGRVFILWLLIIVVSLTLTYGLRVPIDLIFHLHISRLSQAHTLPEICIQTAITFAVQVLIDPILPIALMLIYFDQRTRQEGYDIEQLMLRAGWLSLPPAAGNDQTAGPESYPHPSPESGA